MDSYAKGRQATQYVCQGQRLERNKQFVPTVDLLPLNEQHRSIFRLSQTAVIRNPLQHHGVNREPVVDQGNIQHELRPAGSRINYRSWVTDDPVGIELLTQP